MRTAIIQKVSAGSKELYGAAGDLKNKGVAKAVDNKNKFYESVGDLNKNATQYVNSFLWPVTPMVQVYDGTERMGTRLVQVLIHVGLWIAACVTCQNALATVNDFKNNGRDGELRANALFVEISTIAVWTTLACAATALVLNLFGYVGCLTTEDTKVIHYYYGGCGTILYLLAALGVLSGYISQLFLIAALFKLTIMWGAYQFHRMENDENWHPFTTSSEEDIYMEDVITLGVTSFFIGMIALHILVRNFYTHPMLARFLRPLKITG